MALPLLVVTSSLASEGDAWKSKGIIVKEYKQRQEQNT